MLIPDKETGRKKSGSKKLDFSQFPFLFPQQELEEMTGTAQRTVASQLVPSDKTPSPAKKHGVTGKPSERTEARTVPQFSLDTFVTGSSNRLASKTAGLVVENPGKITPVFIFGPTSVGKTHLLEGIAGKMRCSGTSASPLITQLTTPLLMTAEQFTTAFIDGLRQSGMASFRNKFRGISALLIDDIQFFIGKDSTQSELLRTMDTLIKQGVQLVLTADRPLKELTGLRPELVARIEGGVACEIGPQDRETMYRIFTQWVRQRKLPIGDDVCRFVASRLTMHARQVAGALNLLHATYLSTGTPITLTMAQDVLDEMIRNNRRTVQLKDIDKVVCETFGITSQSLVSKSKAKQVAEPRMLAMWLARKYTRSALSEIGKYFGDRAHSTVLSAEKKINTLLAAPIGDDGNSLIESLQKIERALHSV